ncbi:MAG: hypothetical protein II309_05040 [Bacilli bacterium]|nr:hypothetical protein [Bacilli bacterium]
MKSIRGIYYNLYESEYKYKIDNFEFVFSSLFYLSLFKTNLESYLKYEQERLNNKLKKNIELKEVILIDHYKKIEKRGFLVYYKNKELKDYKFIVNLVSEV